MITTFTVMFFRIDISKNIQYVGMIIPRIIYVTPLDMKI